MIYFPTYGSDFFLVIRFLFSGEETKFEYRRMLIDESGDGEFVERQIDNKKIKLARRRRNIALQNEAYFDGPKKMASRAVQETVEVSKRSFIPAVREIDEPVFDETEDESTDTDGSDEAAESGNSVESEDSGDYLESEEDEDSGETEQSSESVSSSESADSGFALESGDSGNAEDSGDEEDSEEYGKRHYVM